MPTLSFTPRLGRRRRGSRARDQQPCEPIECTADERDGWAHQVALLLRQRGYARLRLPEQSMAHVLHHAQRFFANECARTQLSSCEATYASHTLPPAVLRVATKADPRETCELRPWASAFSSQFAGGEVDPMLAALGTAVQHASTASDAVCGAILRELIRTCSDVEASNELRALTLGGTSSNLNASVLRMHRYTADPEEPWHVPAHCDFGLLSLLPRSNVPALEILVPEADGSGCEWVRIEELMAADELLIFAGSLMSHVDPSVPALVHRVSRAPRSSRNATAEPERISAAYFVRTSSLAVLRVPYNGPPAFHEK